MKNSQGFRRGLAFRLFVAALASAPLVGLAFSCSGCSCYGYGGEYEREECFVWPPADAGEMGLGGAGGGGGGGVPTACPSRADAIPFMYSVYDIEEVLTDGTLSNGTCCYNTRQVNICPGGRAFIVDDTLVVAPVVYDVSPGRGFTGETTLPDVASLSMEDRANLGAAWARDGQLEHASIASFGRFALALLALGAPADLIEDAHRAAVDEVRHARLCFGLASAYAGETIGPGTFPFDGRVEVTDNLAQLAACTAEEGCIGETIAACVAAEQLALATDPAVRRALEIIVADESRHAELAFRTVAWAIRVGGTSVRAAVARVFGAMNITEPIGDDHQNDALVAHGRLAPLAEQGVKRRAMDEVVRPALRRLLDASTASLPHVMSAPN